MIGSPERRMVGLAALGFGAFLGLLATMPTIPDERSSRAIVEWWESVGTPSAAMALVHVLATALAMWLAVAAVIGLAAGSGSRRAALLWRLLSTDRLRHLIGGTILVAATGTPTAAGAQETEPAGARDGIALEDQGPVIDEPIVLTDIGPEAPIVFGHPGAAETEPQPEPVPEPENEVESEPVDQPVDTWSIERGDHLWRIAEETLRDRGQDPTESEVAAYWTRLIAANHDVVGDDPDLVYPGQVVRLPD